LNIWTPEIIKKNEKLPVIIYIHGGTFMNGHSAKRNIRGDFMSNSTNTIYINLNYRMGAFGFVDGLGNTSVGSHF
jgi:para-nitrobenzyl esterase